jgi:hypothetical protein
MDPKMFNFAKSSIPVINQSSPHSYVIMSALLAADEPPPPGRPSPVSSNSCEMLLCGLATSSADSHSQLSSSSSPSSTSLDNSPVPDNKAGGSKYATIRTRCGANGYNNTNGGPGLFKKLSTRPSKMNVPNSRTSARDLVYPSKRGPKSHHIQQEHFQQQQLQLLQQQQQQQQLIILDQFVDQQQQHQIHQYSILNEPISESSEVNVDNIVNKRFKFKPAEIGQQSLDENNNSSGQSLASFLSDSSNFPSNIFASSSVSATSLVGESASTSAVSNPAVNIANAASQRLSILLAETDSFVNDAASSGLSTDPQNEDDQQPSKISDLSKLNFREKPEIQTKKKQFFVWIVGLKL